ncbi:MAG: GCN5-related N-acetyltransferase [Myxococcaceae bacterium]|nr:GCN5-related N-acetyltransferase [Myxococcaceae bacterium]
MHDTSWRQLGPGDMPTVADLLARAFADNPCYSWMHPRERSRRPDLRAFFERNLAWHIPLGMTWVAERAGRVLGTLTLEPPGGVQHGAARTLTHWVIPTLREQGLRTVRRIAAADRAFRTHYLGITGGRAYWHVHAVAVDPEHQGEGVGASLLAHGMRELARLRTDRSVPVVLSTQRERNLPLYHRAGFELLGRHQMGSPHDAFTSWFMRLGAAFTAADLA